MKAARLTPLHLRPRMGGHAIGLEAAHIKWFQARGPDVVPNGLALCSLQHKIFDPGAFTVLPGNHQIVFSRHLMGLRRLRPAIIPQRGSDPGFSLRLPRLT